MLRKLQRLAGAALIVAGTGFLVWAYFDPGLIADQARVRDLGRLALVAVVLGVGALVHGEIRRNRTLDDEAYRLGRDIGEEVGYQRGRRVGSPVLVNLPEGDEVQVRVRVKENNGNGNGSEHGDNGDNGDDGNAGA